MDGKRSYEFLKLYLIPEVGRDRAKNAETMASANIIKAQRVLDLKNRKAGVFSSNKNMRLVEWLDIVKVARQKASRSDESSKTIENVKKHIIRFCGESTRMVDIDKKFCMKWIEYLRTATMMLTLGADIYTTSKLLGHSRISTTEIYAKIVDKKKDEAMGLIDKFFDKE